MMDSPEFIERAHLLERVDVLREELRALGATRNALANEPASDTRRLRIEANGLLINAVNTELSTINSRVKQLNVIISKQETEQEAYSAPGSLWDTESGQMLQYQQRVIAALTTALQHCIGFNAVGTPHYLGPGDCLERMPAAKYPLIHHALSMIEGYEKRKREASFNIDKKIERVDRAQPTPA